jgi:predicted nucleic-acid-binding Zn-ribbon protein
MIINIPSAQAYENIGIECLLQAYTNIYEVDNNKAIEGLDRKTLWQYHLIVLRTSIVLIHQGVESILKANIANKTPLLLIDSKRSDWKTLPESADEDFANFYTIGGEDLIRTFYACSPPSTISPDFPNHFKRIRDERNKIVHGTGGSVIDPDEVLKLILSTFTFIFGQDSFWVEFKRKFSNHPGHEIGADQIEFEAEFLFLHLDYLIKYLGKGQLNNHFRVDLKCKKYHCPECSNLNYIGLGIEPPMWAFLDPNEPTSTNIYCLICGYDYDVERIDCNREDGVQCPGNVIFTEEDATIDEETGEIEDPAEKVCLTCFETQSKVIPS